MAQAAQLSDQNAPWDSDPVVSQSPAAAQAAPDAPWASDPVVNGQAAAGSTRTITAINGKPLPQPIQVPVDASDNDVRLIARQHGLDVSNGSVVLNAQAGQPQESGLRQFGDNLKNDVAGIAQGAVALPDMLASGAGKVLSVIPNLVGQALGAAGHTDAAQWVQDNITHPLANPPQIGDVIENAAPTPDTMAGHVNRIIGNLVGGAAATPTSAIEQAVTSMVGDAPEAIAAVAPKAAETASTAKPNYAQLARDLKIRRTPATNSKAGVSTVLQSGLGSLPGGTPIATASSQEVGDLANAARSAAESAGNISSRQGAGEAIAQGAQKYKADSGQEAKTLYGARDALIGGPNALVPTGAAKAALDDISSRFPTSPAIQQLREHPAIRAIGGAFPGEPTTEEVPTGILDANGNQVTRTVTSGGEPLTLGEVTEALSHVRGVVRNLSEQSLAGKATAPILSRVKQLEQGLEDDVMNAARNADIAAGREPGAPGSAVKAQQDADAFYADRAAALNGALKKPLQSAADDTKVSGEAVYNQVSGDMDAKSGNLARLRDTWFRLPDEAKSTFAATKIDDLGRATPGQQNDMGTAWSFQTFLTNLNRLSPQARKIVFGGNVDGQLQKIATYADRLRQLDRARNFSNTAKNWFAGAFMATVGGAVMHGDLGSAAEAAAALPMTWGGAKLLLSTPVMRDWTESALKAASSDNQAAMRVLTKNLDGIAAKHPALAGSIAGLQRAIAQAANDNLGNAAVASDRQQQPRGQQQ